ARRPTAATRSRPVPEARRAWHDRQSRGVLTGREDLGLGLFYRGLHTHIQHSPIWSQCPCRPNQPVPVAEITSLELLERLDLVRYIHKDVATVEELRYFLERWALRQYSAYRVGYFAMHGRSKQLYLTHQSAVELDEVAEWLEGKCEGRRL